MIILPRRNLFHKIANKVGRRFGMVPFPIIFEPSLPDAGKDTKTTFDAIYASNYWGSDESESGVGSEVSKTARYRSQLIDMIHDLSIKSIFDAPCGDLNWMPLVLEKTGISYIGGDIADKALNAARGSNPNLDVRMFDICQDTFPDADLWHCRDTLFHLSFEDINRAFRQAAASKMRYAAITSHKARMLKNMNITTGGFRLLDLERAPFNFPKPIHYLIEHVDGEFPRYVGIWKMDDIRGHVGFR